MLGQAPHELAVALAPHAPKVDLAPYQLGAVLIPLVVVAMMLLRHARPRRLRVERLWLAPLVFVLMTGLILAAQSPPSPPVIAMEAACLALGGLVGWWRGRLTRVSVDPDTYEATTKTSPLGMLVVLVLFAMRYGLRSASGFTASQLHISALHLTDTLLVFAAGLVCAQRLEMALRAMRLLNEARGRT